MIFGDVYEDEDGWFRFTIRLTNGETLKSGEYAHSRNAERDRSFCIRENNIDSIETSPYYEDNSE